MSSKPSRKFASARSGIISLNQKELKYELKKLELAKRQYETNHYHEQRKMITRFATKISRSSSNLETLFNSNNSNNSTTPNSTNLVAPTTTANNSTNSLTNSLRISSQFKSNNDIPVHETNPKTLTPILTNSNGSNYKKKEKKNVKWNDSVVDKENDLNGNQSNGSNSNFNSYSYRPSLYEMNKRYDEFKLKNPYSEPNVILPQLIAPKRTYSSRPNSSNGSHKEHLKSNDEMSKSKFLNLINEKNTVFYSYKNSKGQPVCSGYDNYIFNMANAKLTPRKPIDQTNENNDKKLFRNVLFDGPGLRRSHTTVGVPTSTAISNTISSSLLRESTNATAQALKLIFYKTDDTPSTTRPTSQLTTTSNDTSSTKNISSTPSTTTRSYSEASLTREDNKLYHDSFKTQSIRSLTFKQIVTY